MAELADAVDFMSTYINYVHFERYRRNTINEDQSIGERPAALSRSAATQRRGKPAREAVETAIGPSRTDDSTVQQPNRFYLAMKIVALKKIHSS